MLHRRGFAELSSSLASLCFADNVVIALARAQKTGRLREEDRELFKAAADFFSDVIAGYKWSDNPAITKNSVQSAAAFTSAINAVRILSEHRNSKAFLAYIERLHGAAQHLAKEITAPGDETRELLGFFEAYAQSELERTDDVANRSREPILWTS